MVILVDKEENEFGDVSELSDSSLFYSRNEN
jgi:hypothetical protein